MEYYGGYQAAIDVNLMAYYASVWLPESAIYSFVGVGRVEGGYLLFPHMDPEERIYYDDIRALDRMPAVGWYSYPLENMPDLWDLRLMCLVGSGTAVPPLFIPPFGPVDSSLVVQAWDKGVDCALGFFDELEVFYMVKWDFYFWFLALCYGYDVIDAADLACSFLGYFYGDLGGTDSYFVLGGRTTITPAAYGD